MNIYGSFLTIGLVFGLIIFYSLSKNFKLPTDKIIEQIFIIFMVSLLGARATYVLLYSNQFHAVTEYFQIWQGGLISFGGIIFGILIAFLIFEKNYKGYYFDILSISFFAGWFFGRIGGFLTQNAIGVKSNFFTDLFYNRVPIQLFEASLSLLIILIGILLLKKFNKIKKIQYNGYLIFLITLSLYCLGRFIIDFWRDQSIVALGLGLGQFISIILFICSIILLRLTIIKSFYDNK